jgi:hypothetical protein
MERTDAEFLVELHRSLAIRWGTMTPYTIGRLRCEQVGFARIPCIVFDVIIPERGLDGLIPVLRQRMYGELAERGWDAESVKFVPGVMRGRERVFVDDNESSGSHGKRKRGVEFEVRWEMEDRDLRQATFPLGTGTYAQLPERPGRAS